MKKLLSHIFIDGMNGMALGFFCTFAIGTILRQLGTLLSRDLGDIFITLGGIALALTGAGIALGMATKFSAPPTVALSAMIAGMVGAHADAIFQSSIVTDHGIRLSGSGDPLGAFVAAFIALELGGLVSGKTQVDMILTPAVCTGLGSASGLFLAPVFDLLNQKICLAFKWSTDQNDIVMGMLVALIMCVLSILPLNTLAIVAMAQLKGISAGAATVGCCCAMVGLAVASYRDNKVTGLFTQGIGTAKLQLSNFLTKPWILLPSLLSCVILGPISTCLFEVTNTAKGCVLGTTGLEGCLCAYRTMVDDIGSVESLLIISLMCFVLPGVLCLLFAEGMKKLKFLKDGDMKIQM